MTAETTTTVLDPLTGAPAQFLFTAKDNRGHPGTFDYYRGTGSHVFLAKIPENLGDYYAKGYQPIPASVAELAAVAKEDAYRLDVIRTLVPHGDFLEIGPWIGRVAYSAKVAGYRTHALEMDQRCVDLMRSAGISAEQSSDPAASLRASEQRYDVIGLWHSIEHIRGPMAVIEEAIRKLNPGGIIVIAAPNPNSAQFRVTGHHWLHLDAPRHLHLVPIEMFEALGRQYGLVTVEKTTDDHLAQMIEDGGWVFEMYRRARPSRLLGRIYNRLFHAVTRRKVRTPGALDGAAFTLILQKPA